MEAQAIHSVRSHELSQFIERVSALPEVSLNERVVYTVLFGGVDGLKPVPSETYGWSFLCVTDRPIPEGSGWTSLRVPWVHRDARRTARVLKLLPWVVAPKARCSLFLDASVRVTGSLAAFEERYCQEAEFVCFPHPDRTCAYQEAQACVDFGKDDPQTIYEQMRRYREEGFPSGQGLVSSGILYRDHRSKDVREMMSRWLDEIEVGSCRDQLSFNYSSWKTGVRYRPVDLDIYDNPYFDVMAHRVLRRFDETGRDVTTFRERLLFGLFLGKVWAYRALRRARRWGGALAQSVNEND